MSANFCLYLQTDDWKGLKKEVNAFLHTLKPEDDPETNFKKIGDWISSHDCVTNVTVQPVEISTDPPIKVITVALNDNGNSLSKTIGIRFSKTKYEINIR